MFGVFNKSEGIDEAIDSVDHNINIHDHCCRITTVQKYKNSSEVGVEWLYRFPSNSSPYSVSVEVFDPKTNERKILKSEIRKKEKAREEYDDAIAEGKTAVLVEKVSGKAEVTVTTSRFEKLTIRKSIESDDDEDLFEMEFFLAAEDHEKDYGQKMQEENGYKPRKIVSLSGSLNFSEGVELKEITCPSHDFDEESDGEEEEEEEEQSVKKFLAIDLEKGEFRTTKSFGQDKEFQLSFYFKKYPVVSCWTEPIVTSENEKLYSTMVTFLPQIKSEVDPEEVTREIWIVVDCSGSMSGSRIRTCRRALQVFMNSMPTSSNTYVNVIRFGSMKVKLFQSCQSMSTETHKNAMSYITNEMNANLGGTNIYDVMEEIINTPRNVIKGEDGKTFERNVFFFGDGEGMKTKETIKLVQQHVNSMGRIFSFGIGNGINPSFLREISQATRGNAVFFDHQDKDLQAKVIRQLQLSLENSLVDVEVKLKYGVSGGEEEKYNLESTTFGPGSVCFNRSEQVGVYLTSVEPLEVSVTVEGEEMRNPEEMEAVKPKMVDQDDNSGIRYVVAQRVFKKLEEERKGNLHKDTLADLGTKIGLLNSQTAFILTCPNDDSFTEALQTLTIPTVSYKRAPRRNNRSSGPFWSSMPIPRGPPPRRGPPSGPPSGSPRSLPPDRRPLPKPMSRRTKKTGGASGGFFGKLFGKVPEGQSRQRAVISAPRNFSHGMHVGVVPGRGFVTDNLPDEWVTLFQDSGIQKEDYEDPEKARRLMKAMKKFQNKGKKKKKKKKKKNKPMKKPVFSDSPESGSSAPPPPPPPPQGDVFSGGGASSSERPGGLLSEIRNFGSSGGQLKRKDEGKVGIEVASLSQMERMDLCSVLKSSIMSRKDDLLGSTSEEDEDWSDEEESWDDDFTTKKVEKKKKKKSTTFPQLPKPPPPEPKKPSEGEQKKKLSREEMEKLEGMKLQDILILGDMMGKFECTGNLARLIGVEMKVIQDEVTENEFWMTALVVAFLQLKFQKRKVEWSLIARKSIKLLKKNNSESLIQKAKEFLKKHL